MGQLFEDMDAIHVYSVGLCALSVCAPKGMTKKRLKAAVNAGHPTGIRHQWEFSKDKTFRTGQSNPCPCEDDPERLHYLMNC